MAGKMNREKLEHLWSVTLRSTRPGRESFDLISSGLVEVSRADHRFKTHIRNTLRRISEKTGRAFDDTDVDLDTARLVVADEIGFDSWDQLLHALEDQTDAHYPILF